MADQIPSACIQYSSEAFGIDRNFATQHSDLFAFDLNMCVAKILQTSLTV